MTKEIKIIGAEPQICKCITYDDRWHSRVEDGANVFRPSVAWIASHYPKGKGFEAWLKRSSNGVDFIEALAAERNFKVHRSIRQLNEGKEVWINDTFVNPVTGQQEELMAEEYLAVMSYADWWWTEGSEQYEMLAYDEMLWPNAQELAEKFSYPAYIFEWAGTIDLLLKRKSDDTIGVVHVMTGLEIWAQHEIQVSAYVKGKGADWGAILQLNYKRNKHKKYKFSEISDRFDLFVGIWKIWKNESEGMSPVQRELPLKVKLAAKSSETKKEGANK